MATAARSFEPEPEAEPAKEARVVGSELVDTYTVCWGRGCRHQGRRLEPRVRVGGLGRRSGFHDQGGVGRAPAIGLSGERIWAPQVQ